jgi:NAD+ synthetase
MYDYYGAAAAATEALHSFAVQVKLPTLLGSLVACPCDDGTSFTLESELFLCRDGGLNAMGFVDVFDAWDEDYYASQVTFKFEGQTITVLLDGDLDEPSEFRDSDIVIWATADGYVDQDDMLTASAKIQEYSEIAKAANVWLICANLAGGSDGTIYSGASLVFNPQGGVCAQAKPVVDDTLLVNLASDNQSGLAQSIIVKPLLPYEADYRAIVTATGDYVRKNDFSDVVLGLSGGIDSALTAAIAVDALGAEHVHGVLMPGPYSSAGSVEDATELAANLGVEIMTLPITEPFACYQKVFAGVTSVANDNIVSIALQNLQARIRANYLMHLSNTYGWMLLNTGNKSEAAMGYSTLYGDTCGAFAPLGNVYKGDVYELAAWRNQQGSQLIPQNIIDKEPSAELYDGQRDVDSLPPYDILDKILRLHIEDEMSLHEIVEYLANDIAEPTLDGELVASVLNTVRAAEYKRRQEPLAPDLSLCEMNTERDWPYTNGLVERTDIVIAPMHIVQFLQAAYHDTDHPGANPQSMGIFAN